MRIFILGILTGWFIVAVTLLIVANRGGVVIFTKNKTDVKIKDEVDNENPEP